MNKRNRKKIIAYALVGAMSIVHMFGGGVTSAAAKKVSVKLNKTSVTVNKGKKVTLKVVKKNVKKVKGIKWSVKDKKIASVSKKGVVKGVKAGKTTVTCKLQYQQKGKKKFQKKTLKCQITVKGGGTSEQEEEPTTQPTTNAAVSAQPSVTTAVPVVTTSVAPEESKAPEESGAPEESTAPTESSAPEESTAPTESSAPEESTAPIESGAPEESTAPTESGAPEESGAPIESATPSETNAPLPGQVILKVDPNWTSGQMPALAVDKTNFATYTAEDLTGKKITLTYTLADDAETTMLGVFAGAADENQGGVAIKGKESTDQTEYTFEITAKIAAALIDGGLYVTLSDAMLTSAVLTNGQQGGEIIEPTPEVTEKPEETAKPTETAEATPEVTETEKPEETTEPTPEVTEKPEETAGPTSEVTETKKPEETTEPTPEVTETKKPEETTEPTPEVTETKEPEETTEPTPEVTETEKPEETAEPTPEDAVASWSGIYGQWSNSSTKTSDNIAIVKGSGGDNNLEVSGLEAEQNYSVQYTMYFSSDDIKETYYGAAYTANEVESRSDSGEKDKDIKVTAIVTADENGKITITGQAYGMTSGYAALKSVVVKDLPTQEKDVYSLEIPEPDTNGNINISSDKIKEAVSPSDSIAGYVLTIEGKYISGEANQYNTGVNVYTGDWSLALSTGTAGWDGETNDAFTGSPLLYELSSEQSKALLEKGLVVNINKDYMEVTAIYFAKAVTIFEASAGQNGDFSIGKADIQQAVGENTTSLEGYTAKISMLPTAELEIGGFQIILKSKTSGTKIVGVADEWGQEWINKGTTSCSASINAEQSKAILEEGLSAWCTKTDGVGITKIQLIVGKS